MLIGGSEPLLVTGDVLHHPFQAAHPEWPSTHDADPVTGVATRRALLERARDGRTITCVPHFARLFGRVGPAGWTDG